MLVQTYNHTPSWRVVRTWFGGFCSWDFLHQAPFDELEDLEVSKYILLTRRCVLGGSDGTLAYRMDIWVLWVVRKGIPKSLKYGRG
jgi:hypothetical protein